MRGIVYSLLLLLFTVIVPSLSEAQPVANFSASSTSGCSPIVVSFTDLSTGSPTSWSWDLGNGTTSTLQNPSTTYTTPGSYTVKLTATNASGSNTKTITSYITVIASPTVAFTASDTTSKCPPFTESFTNSSTAGTGTATYSWDFGDGYTSTATNPTHTYTSGGNFNVTLIVTNSSGCSKSLVKTSYIHMNAIPTISFSASSVSGCSAPFTVSFTNGTTGATSYSWDFGDGGTSTSTSPSHTYSSTGTYNVRLIATNSLGCSDTLIKTSYINVGSFAASFIKSSSSVCINNAINFTNTSSAGYTSSSWSFGDGGTSTATNPSHSYTTAGTYTVKLIVGNGSCSDSATQTVIVNPQPSVHFTGDTLTSCKIPQVVNFTNTTTGASTYAWSFGDGGTSTATNPSHTYSSFMFFTVKLVATSSAGCKDSLIRSGYVQTAPLTGSITASPNGGCAPATISFSESISATLASYTWFFGDGSTNTSSLTPSHTYSTAGNYTVSFAYRTTTGCIDTLKTTLNVSNKPTAGFTVSSSPICTGTSIGFTNTSTGATGYTWYFGDGNSSNSTNPTHSYLTPDSFTVTLVAYNGSCADTLTKTKVVIVKGPYTHFNYQVSCGSRLTVSFTNYSTSTHTSSSWAFGDGNTSTTFSPSHTYSTYGTYNVTLNVYDSVSGCTGTETRQVDLFALTSTFTASDSFICKNTQVKFKGVYNANYSSYTWIFGDGSSSTTSEDSTYKTYTTSGIYTVSLVVTDNYGCKDTTTKTNYMHVGGANVKFGASNACEFLAVNFTDSSTDAITITGRKWVWGDGGSLTGNNATPTHTYTALGTYDVKLVVTDSLGCKDSLTKTALINISKPTAGFTAADTLACPGLGIAFTNTSTNGVTYLWKFGDGTTSTSANPTHAYSTGGYYNVTLIATNANGCNDTLVRNNYIHVITLNLGFTMSDSFANCPPLTDYFTNTSTGISSYYWTFGNGGSSITTNPTAIYTYPGVYKVWLRGTNASGCTDSVSKTVTVNGPRGSLSYSPVSGCGPLTISFTSTDTNATTITWDMNNGTTTTNSTSSSGVSTNTYSYTYTTAGVYVPLIVLTNASSCSIYIRGIDTIKVDKVTADFRHTPDSFCGNGTVSFIDTTIYTLSPVTSIDWIFGDGGTASGHDPSHTYTSSGTYQVKMIMSDSSGCKDTVIKTVTIFSLPTVNAGPDKSFCQGTTGVSLSASGASTYTWSPATGLSCTACTSPTASPTTTTTYVVTGTDTHGCANTDTVVVRVHPKPAVSAGPDKTICQGSSATLTATGASTYSWSPATGLSCTACSGPTASPTSTTSYIVTGTDTNSCSNIDTVIVHVNPLPTVSAGPDKQICKGSSTTLTGSGASTYSWSPTTGLSCSSCASPTASPTSTTTYALTGTDSNSCVNHDTVIVVVHPLPSVSAGPDKQYCIGGSVTLNASGASTYSWSPATGLSCTACASPTASATTTTTYVVTGTDTNNCVNTDTVIVKVNALPIVSAGPDQSVCKGSGATLTATGASSYVWSPATGLSCTACANPTATPIGTASYYVTGTDANGCKNTDTVVVNIKPLPVIKTGPDQSICQGKSTVVKASGAVSYVWTPSSGLSCSSCDSSTASPSATTTYTVTGTGTNGCKDTAKETVTVYQLPVIKLNHPDTTLCNGSSIQLLATGASTYTWSPSSGLSCNNCPDPVLNATANSTYTITGTDVHGCIGSTTLAITVINKQPMTVGPGDTLCRGQSVTVYATGGTQYIWSPSAGLSSISAANPTASPDSTTVYTVIVKQGDCFADTGQITVFVYQPPTVTAGGGQTILAGGSVTLDATGKGILQYEWSPPDDLSCIDCPSPTATPKKTTKYTVTVTGEGGCKASSDVTVTVNCDNTQIFVPNTFTPNGDGLNDRFYPSGKGIGTVKRFSVYNRWGELVFDMHNMPLNEASFGWDGTFNGKEVKPDVFVYVIEAECETGQALYIKGDVSLVR